MSSNVSANCALIDSVDVSFNRRMMEVVLSRWWIGANVCVFATDSNVYNGKLRGRAFNWWVQLRVKETFVVAVDKRVFNHSCSEGGVRSVRYRF